jgi:hypothetical protein
MKDSKHFDFRTIATLYMAAGGVIAFLVHFFVLSTPWANGIYNMTR